MENPVKEIAVIITCIFILTMGIAIMLPSRDIKCEEYKNNSSMFVPARCFDNFNPSN